MNDRVINASAGLATGPLLAMETVTLDANSFGSLQRDASDLAAGLHVLADAAARRGDQDLHGSARLLARHCESMQLAIERLGEEATAAQ